MARGMTTPNQALHMPERSSDRRAHRPFKLEAAETPECPCTRVKLIQMVVPPACRVPVGVPTSATFAASSFRRSAKNLD